MNKTLPFHWNEFTASYEAHCRDCGQMTGAITKEYLAQSNEKPPFFMSHKCPTEWRSTPDGTMRVMYVPDGPKGDPEESETCVPDKDRTAMGVTIGIVLGVVLIALILTVFWPKPPAAEVTPDQSFVTQVRAGTTKLESIRNEELISLGHKACTARKQGMSREQTLANIYSSTTDPTVRNDLAYTVGAAYKTYCPEYTR